MSKKSFERKLTKEGKKNPKYIDLLDVDKAIAGQNFCCISFLTPEKILKDKKFQMSDMIVSWKYLIITDKGLEKLILF